MHESGEGTFQRIYGRSIFRVILIACITIICSVVLIGTLSYWITEKEVVSKLKTKDLGYIAESISSKIDGRINRAKETALILARDPSIMDWVKSGEKEQLQGDASIQKVVGIAKDYDYSNTFIVSAITNHYWAENGRIIETMSKDNPNHKWFYETLESTSPVSVQIDYNDSRDDTFVFVNAVMSDAGHPIAVVGVGLSLMSMAEEFDKLKYGEHSTLRIIDDSGNIYLSDQLPERGKNIDRFIPNEVKEGLLNHIHSKDTFVTQYQNPNHEVVDLISYPIQSADWKLVVEVPRQDTVSFLNTIKFNTLIATLLLILFSVFLFYYISKYLANPYKRALEVNQELEKKVWERTEELHHKNQTLLDSIDYAKRIQESTMPSKSKLDDLFQDYFLLWKPRDVVGGDFFWVKSFGEDYLVAIGDCTGHGVPGACMTMMVLSILNHVVTETNKENPASILKEINKMVKEILHQEHAEALTDDGLDLGLCYIHKENRILRFAGAKTDLYIKTEEQLEVIKGNRKSLGYRRTRFDYDFTNTDCGIVEGQTFVMTTDGFLDQNGGEKNFSFGRKRWEDLIRQMKGSSLSDQMDYFTTQLEAYMGKEPQRDDILVIAFHP
ncbi:MAG TPA: SpoIIE family protein phosphatase [Bacillota bacterium]|nr:SpoIIE family protein phosphatase [Bacillota bacterium]